MVVEFFDVALGAVEGAFLVHDFPGGKNAPRSSAAAVPLGTAALSGLAVGAFAHTQNQAIWGSALAGGAIPLFGRGKITGAGIAMAAITSTAVGLVTYTAKTSWVQHEGQKKAHDTHER